MRVTPYNNSVRIDLLVEELDKLRKYVKALEEYFETQLNQKEDRKVT